MLIKTFMKNIGYRHELLCVSHVFDLSLYFKLLHKHLKEQRELQLDQIDSSDSESEGYELEEVQIKEEALFRRETLKNLKNIVRRQSKNLDLRNLELQDFLIDAIDEEN